MNFSTERRQARNSVAGKRQKKSRQLHAGVGVGNASYKQPVGKGVEWLPNRESTKSTR